MSSFNNLSRERFARMSPFLRCEVRNSYRRCRRVGMGVMAAKVTVETCIIAGVASSIRQAEADAEWRAS